MSVGYLEVGPDRFPVAVQGEGPPILFVHGVPGDWRTFAPHAALLAGRYRCITFTQRWFGTAQWREDGPPFGTATHAEDLIAVAEALEMGPLALVAWSYGAHSAFKAALDRPDLFSALFVYEPGFASYVDDPFLLRDFTEDVNAAWGPVVAARSTGDLDETLRAMWDGSGGPGSFDALPPETQDQLRDSAHVISRLLDQAPPVPLTCNDLADIRIPVTVAWGRRSRRCFTIPSQTAAFCTGGDRTEIADSDHMWPALRPDAFAKVVDYWLSGLRDAGRI